VIRNSVEAKEQVKERTARAPVETSCYAELRARFLSKNENVNWLEDGFTLAVRCVRPQRPHPGVKVAATQTSQN